MKLFPSSRPLHIFLLLSTVLLLTAAGTLFWLTRHLTGVVEETLRRTYGPDLSLGHVEVGWNRVILNDLRIRNPAGGPIANRISIGRVVMTPHFRALLSRHIEINSLQLEHPQVLVEVAPNGSVISPLASRHAGPRDSRPADTPPRFSLAIRHMSLIDGELILLDRTSSRLKHLGVSNRAEGYHLTRFTQVSLHTGPLAYPLSPIPLPVNLSLAAPGPGSLTIIGTISPVTLDTNLTVTLRHWDITKFKPYYLKPGDHNVIHGFLGADAKVSITQRKLQVPGEIRLAGLELDPAGQGLFMGMSSHLVLGILKNDRGSIDTAFLLSGDLDNPHFKVEQSLLAQIGSGLARKLGIPIVSDIGKGIYTIGEKGAKGIMKLFGATP